MPALLPTPAELRNLDPETVERVRRAVWAIVIETDKVAAQAIAERRNTATIEEARKLQAELPPEDPALIEQRRAILLAATQ